MTTAPRQETTERAEKGTAVMNPRNVVWGVLLTCVAAFPARAQDQVPVAVQGAAVEFDFDDAELRIVIGALAEAAGLNILFGQLPTDPVTLRTSRPIAVTEVRGLLESLARAHGLELIDEEGFIRIIGPAPITTPTAGRRPVGGPPQAAAEEARRLYVYPLRHARAEVVLQTLRGLFRLGGGPDQPAGSGDLALSEALRQQQVAPIQPDAPPAAAQALPAVQEPGIAVGLQQTVDMVEDPTSNALLILATPTDYQVIQGAIDALDTRPLQVLIEVLVAEVRHNRNTALGIDVNVPLDESDDPGVSFRLQGLSAGDVALQILGIGSIEADVVVRALATMGDVNILSRPVLLAQNNSEARILVGDQRPFIQVFRALPTDNAVRDQVVQYRNVGTQLAIRPTISHDGYVNLAVVQEVSTATAETQFGAPVINTREAETDLLVRDGQTVVLGGLIDNQRETTNSGVPFLKDIPLLGLLFRSTTHRVVKSELLLMLTTHVVHTDDELNETFEQLRERMPELNEHLPDTIPLIPGPRADTTMAGTPPDTIPASTGSGTARALLDPSRRSRP